MTPRVGPLWRDEELASLARGTPLRRAEDLACLVRCWVAQGAVDADAATRFLLARQPDVAARRARWVEIGRPRRRRDDPR